MEETTTEIVPVEVQKEIQVAKRVKNKKLYREELAKQINEAYAEYQKTTGEIHALALTMENRRIILGSFLHSAKKDLGHGKFKDWLAANCKDIPERSARRYMQFAAVAGYKVLTDIHNLRDYQKVLVALGLREPTQGQAVQQLHEYNYYAVFTKTALTAVQRFKEVFDHQPLEDIDDDIKEQMREKLAPFVELYEKLI